MGKKQIKSVPDPGVVQIRGARQNNLKGIDLDLPLGKLNVISGPSGSGKSSLAFDTIYAEGQRRYVETFSPYTRQFLERMDKPKVDEIRGIPPAIAIEQANSIKSTRSTVGTMTEINDYLKLLFPHAGKASCPSCSRPIRPETARSIVDHALTELAGETALLTFAVPVPEGTDVAEFFGFLKQQGYLRVWLEGAVHRTDEPPTLKRLPAVVPVIQDRVRLEKTETARLCEALDTALRFGKGKVSIVVGTVAHPYSVGWHCAHCDFDIAPPSAPLFSFNNAIGACPTCRGFGRSIGIDLERAVPDRNLSIKSGVVKAFQGERGQECQRDLLRHAAQREVDIQRPFKDLPEADQRWVLQGERAGATGDELWEDGLWYGVRGFFQWLETKTYKMHVRVFLSRYRSYNLCVDCGGTRLKPAALNFRIGGKTLPELLAMPVAQLADLVAKLNGDPTVEMLVDEVASRLRYLVEVGLGYLTLDRPSRTLSGGEVERVNLTSCLGASLVNALFVLDEPSVGLHPRDVGQLIKVMRELRDKGNTLLVVEHEESVIRAADNVIEIGPGRGEAGGSLVYSGPVAGISKVQESLTGDYLSGKKRIPVPTARRSVAGTIGLRGATAHNLQNIDVDFPLGVFTCVTGVSGSGKSTLVHEELYNGLMRARGLAVDEDGGGNGTISGAESIGDVVLVDQSPLSRTPRSSPALYLGVFDHIRELFAMLPESLVQGLTASSFSFNSGTGRCERCCGTGFEKIEMQFLSDIFVRCPECDGKRFQPHILKIKLAGKSIHEVLELTVTEAIWFFGALEEKRGSKLSNLKLLEDVGLGYLRLGHPLNVLSGGESQRLKLVSHLVRGKAQNNLLILDEPTTGLHFDDVAMLLKVFDRLVQQGNTLIVIEHNIEVIKCADHVIDLGPEAGEAGGTVVGIGTPETVAEVRESHTARYLREALAGRDQPADFLDAASLRVAEEPQKLQWNGGAQGISIRGAREHNLKNISLTIPRDEMVIITGLSGSGKSTLAFDILFAEGQRRFLDSMSPYARQFIDQLEKPDVDLICGLPPTVAIEQRLTRGGGKSTVATVTETYHFLRLLFAKVGMQFCPRCNVPVEKQTLAAVTRQAELLVKKGTLRVLAPLIKARKGFHTEVARWAVNHGFETLLVDGEFVQVMQFQKLERFREHTIDVVVGSTAAGASLRDLVRRALEIGKGAAKLLDRRGEVTVVSTEMSCPACGDSFEELDPRMFSFNSPHGWCGTCRGFGEVFRARENARLETELEKELDIEKQHEWLEEGESEPCDECDGSRLNAVARHVQVQGQTMMDLTQLSVTGALDAVRKLKFKGRESTIAADILPEIAQRLLFMGNVGLGYLALNRSATTLSGGESQRIRLAAQLGSNLRGVLYVLDEPTIGLHPRDNEKLLDTLQALKEKGNSLVIVEHDEDTMRRADTIIDLGPAAGVHGGEVVARGTLAEIKSNKKSITGRCLSNPLCHPTTSKRRPLDETPGWIEVKGARLHNLKEIDVRFPIGRLSVVTGISGSGKSTLMRGVLKPLVTQALARKGKKAIDITIADTVQGHEHLEAVYEVDQSPIGKTSRSTPATYIKVFDEIRNLYAQMPLARMRGYTASRFSFNSEGGRCPACLGQGVVKVEMNFLPTSYLPCIDCHGARYTVETLEVLFNDKSIGDVMQLSLEQAAEFFSAHTKIHRALSLLVDTGLGYLKLGQPSPTLSGGEAQRLKLVSELTRGVGRAQNERLRKQRAPKSTLYLLEEPTIGLHMADVEELLKVLHRLVDDGNTVIVIEHNMTVAADADYVVDIGPQAGESGGEVMATGTPEEVARKKNSCTAPFLQHSLEAGAVARGKAPRKKKRWDSKTLIAR